MQTCSKCGSQSLDDAVFCSICGERLAVPVSDSEAKIAQWVNLARTGDQDAIEELINATQNQLFFRARGYTHNDADAQEVVQKAYINAFM